MDVQTDRAVTSDNVAKAAQKHRARLGGIAIISNKLHTPHRWIRVGEEAFGRWLLDIRPVLLAGGSINLSGPMPANVRWSL